MAEKKKVCSNSKDENTIHMEKNSFDGRIENLKSYQLKSFRNHPFNVEVNSELFELMLSIEKDGILVPLLVRPNPMGEGYEIISGHRRKAACDWAGITDIPVMIRNLDDNQAVVAMVDSNLQREHIKPSEKAFAYKMRLEAMRKQGKRCDLTSDQVEPKWENPTLEVKMLNALYDEDGKWKIDAEQGNTSRRSNEMLAKQVGESVNQIKRYIRLTNLIPKLLDMVDEGKMAFTIAVELSYLTEAEQYELHAVMELEQCSPSLSQANRLKRMSQSKMLNMDEIYQVLGEEKPNQREQLKIRADKIAGFFPTEYTERQKLQLIEELLKEWHEASKGIQEEKCL